MIANSLKKLFGTRNDRELKRIRKTVLRINRLEEEYEALLASGWTEEGPDDLAN